MRGNNTHREIMYTEAKTKNAYATITTQSPENTKLKNYIINKIKLISGTNHKRGKYNIEKG